MWLGQYEYCPAALVLSTKHVTVYTCILDPSVFISYHVGIHCSCIVPENMNRLGEFDACMQNNVQYGEGEAIIKLKLYSQGG